ncbi:alpha-2-macroglobulin family protein [Campylobacter sp. VBCF_01 NA2]|uniref:alpha-2-macroglobulin family protein n=1 Tax=Campylobacter sp. VBCF_01 NA2 TaxID=2983836 RepID=UPI0022E9F08C|nr:alpha-2-macroglobulin family protein [Campylobacter sp. VBCF_01 NA2]WBR54993.1 hypothetical protein PF027_03725 [Campylobacter sp. VBCF_01 NA2]
MEKILIKFGLCSALCAGWLFGVETQINDESLIFSGAKIAPFGISEEQIAKCAPGITGVYEYKNSAEIEFYPKTKLNASTRYNCEIGGEKFSFTTAGFSASELKILRPGLAKISFNDSVSEEGAKSGIRVYSLQNLAKNDISFTISAQNDRSFLISYDAKHPNIVIEANSVKSKNGATLSAPKILKADEEPFNDSINASNLDDVKIREISFNDGSFGARLYFPHYVDDANLAKFIRVNGVGKFSLGEARYRYYEDEQKYPQISDKYYYHVDIKSAEFAPNKSYELRLLKGFGDDSRIVRDEIKLNFKTGDRKPFVQFSDMKKFVPKNANIAIKSSNLNEISISVSKISEENFRYFLNFESNYPHSLASEVVNKKFDIGGAKNEISEHKIAMDFKGFEDGVYVIDVHYKEGNIMRTITRTAYISDISAQVSMADSGALIYTSRLSDAKALSHAIVKIYNDKNEMILEKRTDSDGILLVNDAKFLDKNPKSIEITDGKERGFVIFDEAVSSREATTSDARAMVYFASELVSPNEALIGSVVLKKSDFTPIKNTPIKYKITDPYGVNIITRALKTDSYGALNFKENLGEKSGSYTFELIYEDKIIETKKFSVENFIPNRVKNEILTSKDEIYKDELIIANLISNYLVGAPAASLASKFEVKSYEKELKISGFEGYSFTNARLKKEGTLEVKSEEFRLDNNGKKDLVIAPKAQGVSNAANLMMNFSVQDGGKNVSAYKMLSYYPYEKILGIRANKDFISSGEEVKFDLALLDSVSKKEQKGKVDLEIYRQDFTYIYDGERYVEQESFSLVDSISAEGSQIGYKFENGGSYIVVANDYASGASASVRVDVSGYGYYGRLNAKDVNTARINLEKSKLKPGEMIKGVITSPIENGVLNVALIGEGVYDYKITQIRGNSASFELRVPENFTGGHISASISRSASGAAMPLRTYANVAVSLDVSEKKLPLSLQNKSEYKNGEKAIIVAKSAPNSKITLYAVDLGILDAINQKELNAFSYFDKPIYFRHRYFDIFDDLSVYSANGKELSFGGDEMLKSAKRNLSPVQNKKDKKFVKMYEGIANGAGEARFEVDLPKHFNSMIRLSALALDDEEKIGWANSQISVKDDIVIKPADLTYMVKGDDINIPLTLINTTNSPKSLNLKASFNDAVQISLSDANITLGALEAKNLKFRANALELGEGVVSLEASEENGAKFEYELKFDVISQFPRSKFSASAYSDAPMNFSLPASYKDVFTYIGTRPSTYTVARELERYPYGCTEQISSKILAYDFFFKRDHDEAMKGAVLEHATKILSRLKNNGEFGYWSAHGETNAFASLYASDVLLDMDAKYKILTPKQKELILRALRSSYSSEPSLRLYADFVLDRVGALSDDELNFVYDKKLYEASPLATFSMLAILQKHKMSAEFSKIYSSNYKFDYANKEASKIFASEVRDAGFALYALGSVGIKDSVLDTLAQNLSQNLQDIYSTQERAFVLRALEAYFGEDDKGVGADIVANGLTQSIQTPSNSVITLNSNDREIKISPKNGEKIFANLLSFGYEPVALKHSPLSINNHTGNLHGIKQLEIVREFVDEAGNAVLLDNLKVGQRIYSKINFRSNFYIRNFVIDEAASTCFEIVNERINPGFIRPENLQDKTSFEHKEIMFDRVLSFPVGGAYYKDTKNGNDYTGVFYTPLNVVYSGMCALPAVSITDMQNESVMDYDLPVLNFKIK